MVHFGQFEKFEQIWCTVKGRTLKLKKRFDNSICAAFHLPTDLLLYVPYMQYFKKMHVCETALLVVQNWGKMAYLPQPTTGTSF